MIMNNLKVQVRISCTFGKPQAVEILGACFSPYKAFFSLQCTHMGLIPMSHKAFKLFNIDFLLNLAIEEGCLYIHLNTAAREMMVLMVVYLATGANVSS